MADSESSEDSDSAPKEGPYEDLKRGGVAILVMTTNILLGGLAFSQIEGWKYMNSCWFSLTLLTTVGYGSFAPVTAGGKVFLVFYAAVTIVIAPIGLNRLANMFICLVGLAIPGTRGSLSRNQRLCVTTISLLMHLFVCGGMAFAFIEDWGYGDALYFSFVTLTTIGLGDFHPKTNAGMGWSFFFILTGLGIVSIVIEEILDMQKELAVAMHVGATKAQQAVDSESSTGALLATSQV